MLTALGNLLNLEHNMREHASQTTPSQNMLLWLEERANAQRWRANEYMCSKLREPICNNHCQVDGHRVWSSNCIDGDKTATRRSCAPPSSPQRKSQASCDPVFAKKPTLMLRDASVHHVNKHSPIQTYRNKDSSPPRPQAALVPQQALAARLHRLLPRPSSSPHAV
ncbi:hypothetical protein LZ30DRAFT_142194 [Colletotrichum cereale]|nr:hypothetical protein LZ30DRAFT_142194 [Colletotrichum cereale]